MLDSQSRSRLRPRTLTSRAVAVLTAASMVAAGAPTWAREATRGLPIIRDAEIEQLLKDYTAPILKVAGLSQQNIQVVIINDRSFNAFVADGRRIFVNVGALMQAKTPNELIGVFAHETGHLAGGHLARMREEVARAETSAIIAMLAGLGAAVAGATSRGGASDGAGQVGMAALMAPQSVLVHTLLAYQRA